MGGRLVGDRVFWSNYNRKNENAERKQKRYGYHLTKSILYCSVFLRRWSSKKKKANEKKNVFSRGDGIIIIIINEWEKNLDRRRLRQTRIPLPGTTNRRRRTSFASDKAILVALWRVQQQQLSPEFPLSMHA